jgi:hypothetical protein
MTGTLKSYIRDINLNMIAGTYDVQYDTSKSRSKYQFLKPNWKLIKYVTNLGGVIAGSRALKCCTINNRPMFDRKPNDFDFLITKKMAFQIFDHFKFKYNLTDKIISIKKQIWTSYDHYGTDNTRYGAVDVHLIIVDELPEFIEQNGIRIVNFSYVINEKLKMIDDTSRHPSIDKASLQKHADDLAALTMRFNLIVDNE